MCGSQCYELGPPPDSILSMPPPPLPSFLVPRTAIVALVQNDTQPCFAAFMCDTSPGPNEHSGIEFIELPGSGINDVWLFLLIATLVGVAVIVTVLSFMMIKCREENGRKQPPKGDMHVTEPHMTGGKSQTFLPGDILYPCQTTEHVLQQQLAKENRMLWAALTPHGTRHFVSSGQPFPNYEDHYEVIDYRTNKPMPKSREATLNVKKNPIKSFDNNGFTDFDYEDVNMANELYHDDHDSGYQEPHEVINTMNRNSPRLLVSTPTRIENPNIPPLNMHPHRNGTLTLNKKSTLTRRTSESLNYYGSQNI